MNNPCKNCEKRGCGAYHDKCKPYQKYKEEVRKAHKEDVFSRQHRSYVNKNTWKNRANNVFKIHKSKGGNQ